MDPVTGTMLAIPSVISLLSGLFGGGGQTGMSGTQKLLLEDMLRLQNTRAQGQTPLYNAVNNLAMNLLPRSAFRSTGRYSPITTGQVPGQSPNSVDRGGGRNETRSATEQAVAALGGGVRSPMSWDRERMTR
jgi:hypothetical protein